MEVGVALPQMVKDFDRDKFVNWCEGIDAGPFSSISAGERITFHNLEGIPACAAAAALTERVKVFANLIVMPWHTVPLITKQLIAIDVISNGRLEIGVGIGGRKQDYEALGVNFGHLHQRLDDSVIEMLHLWKGGAAGDGGVLGPPPPQAQPLVLAGAMGPKALARAAKWADGVSGFTITANAEEAEQLFLATSKAWANEGKTKPPRQVTGFFCALGPDAENRLRNFSYEYLEVFGPLFARSVAEEISAFTPERIGDSLEAIAAAGGDECILVPGSADPKCLEELSALVADRGF